jgi:hypothetical protein
VQQRRSGLIEALDVMHVVKEERQLERPGRLALVQLDGSGGLGVEDELESGGGGCIESGGTRPPALLPTQMVQWRTVQKRGRRRQLGVSSANFPVAVARVQPPRRMPWCSAACDAVVSRCGGPCQCHRGPPWECRVRRDFASSRQRDSLAERKCSPA